MDVSGHVFRSGRLISRRGVVRRSIGLVVLAVPGLLVACGRVAPQAQAPSLSAAPSSSVASVPAASTPAATITSAVSTAASAASSSAATPSAAGSAPATTGSLLIWHGWGTTGGGVAMVDQVAAFKQAHPGFTIEVVTNANVQKLVAAIAGSNPPDVMQLNQGDVATLAMKQALMPLDASFAQDHIDMAGFWPVCTQIVSFLGKRYGMPHHQGCYVLFWNRSLFQQAGLDPEKAPATWSDITNASAKLIKQQGDQYTQLGFVPTLIQTSWSLTSFISDGLAVLSPEGRRVAFETAAAISALNWNLQVFAQYQGGYNGWNTWYNKVKTTLPSSGPPPQTLYTRSQLALLWWGNWLFNGIQTLSPDLPWGVAALPQGPESSAPPVAQAGGGALLAIPTGAKHVSAGWQFLAFEGSADGQYLVQKNSSDVAALIAAAEDPRIVGAKLGRQQVLPLFKSAVVGATIDSPISGDLNPLVSTMENDVLTGKQSANDALHSAATTMNAKLADYYKSV
mgnify:CR=1 FL=1